MKVINPSVANQKEEVVADRILYVQYGSDIQQIVQDRTLAFIKRISQFEVEQLPSDSSIPVDAPQGSFVLSFGSTPITSRLITADQLNQVGLEGFVIQSGYDSTNSITIIAGDGNPSSYKTARNTNIGAHYAVYHILDYLGISFLHPLQITFPSKLNLVQQMSFQALESPYWEVRGMHIHTMHPLELTEFMNGFGQNLSTLESDWAVQMNDFTGLVEWLVANKQNRMEWILLFSDEWKTFASSSTRQRRFQTLTDICHQFGIMAGADVPIAEEQQHAWPMISATATMEQQIQQIHDRIDWLMEAGFDFLSTENGFSEFTHPDDTKMVAWMNETAIYLDEKYSKKAYIKVHCSTGQTCANYVDPNTGEPLNFNFLPIYADERMGIMPHTVQMYNFYDPVSGSYGNQNFTYMFDFLKQNMGTSREVLYHGETAYWVSFDINVPLFLPIYGLGRISDLRLIAAAEISQNMKIQGQMNFDSGWEWGYWLNSVITMRASWNPHLELADDSATLKWILQDIFKNFGSIKTQLVNVLMNFVSMEYEVLILGKVNGIPPEDTYKLNGVAYLAGYSAWTDIGCDFSSTACTQAMRVGLESVRSPLTEPKYHSQIRPLLEEMVEQFESITVQVCGLLPGSSMQVFPFVAELCDAVEITYWRAVQLVGLYEYAGNAIEHSIDWRLAHLDNAIYAMYNASEIVHRREEAYRVPLNIIGGWRRNPTVYEYTYLWETHSLYFWYRDYEKALDENKEVLNPCYMNIDNALDVAFGEGILTNVTEVAIQYLEDHDELDGVTECLEPPPQEPHYEVNGQPLLEMLPIF